MAGFLKVGAAPKYNGNFVKKVLIDKGCSCALPQLKFIDEIVEAKEQFLDRLMGKKQSSCGTEKGLQSFLAAAVGWKDNFDGDVSLFQE